MARPITLKINVTRIDKKHLYEGKNGKYLNLAVFPNKNGKGQFGDTHFVCQEVSKEAREAGEKGPIIGSLTMPEEQGGGYRQPQPRQQSKPAQQSEDSWENDPAW